MKRIILKIKGLISSKQKDKTFFFIKGLIGEVPKDIELYKLAFTHKSTITNKRNHLSNERLEFLGDSVLGSIMSDILYKRFEFKTEGELTRYRSNVVKRSSLNQIAVSLGFDTVLIAAPNANISKRIYGDMFEAFIGALYLDKGYRFCQHFVKEKIVDTLLSEEYLTSENNYKSQLLEWGQHYRKQISFVEERFTDNNEIFKSYVVIENERMAEGIGKTKKESHNNAARATLDMVKNKISDFKIEA